MLKVIKNYKEQFLLLGLWLVIILLVNPIGDFPLNDDWSYAKSVRTLYDEGYLKLYNWGEMTLVSHVFWGYLFVKIFGFSFTVLRFSTLLLGFGTILGIYELLRLTNTNKWMAVFAAAIFVANPIFLSLSFSYMTDVPFLCIMIWAIYYFVKALQTDTWKPVVIAIFFCCWALLIRQLILVLPLAWAISVLLTKKRSLKIYITAFLPGLLMLCFYLLYGYLMESNGVLQDRYNSKFDLLLRSIKGFDFKLLKNMIVYAFVTLAYLGFLLAPIHILDLKKYKMRGIVFLMIVYTVAVSGILIFLGKTIPSVDNILIDFGVGPTTLFDYYGNFTSSPAPNAPALFWTAITVIGVFASVALILKSSTLLKDFFAKKRNSPVHIFSFVFLRRIPYSIFNSWGLRSLFVAIISNGNSVLFIGKFVYPKNTLQILGK